MSTPLPRKLGIKPGMRAFFLNAPKEVSDVLDAAGLSRASDLTDSFEYIHAFVKHQSELADVFAKFKPHLSPGGTLWISWPKGKKLDSDLTLPLVIQIGYSQGLVESKCISVNERWSALKFTWPIEGKVYNNSFGQLAQD